MEKRTLKFSSLHEMAKYSKQFGTGYLMNTSNLTLTGYFSENDITMAKEKYAASLIETTEKVFSYESL